MFGVLWPSMLAATVLAALTTVAGWRLGRRHSLPPVRLIAWWVTRVAVPLVKSPAWSRRATIIFLNNTVVLATVVALGAWRAAAFLGVAGLGLSLGIGLRILSGRAEHFPVPVAPTSPRARSALTIGVVLNLLEPPAIVLALGLALGRQAIPLSKEQTWTTFAVWVVPALLIAAAGEALWLGAGRAYPGTEEAVASKSQPGHSVR